MTKITNEPDPGIGGIAQRPSQVTLSEKRVPILFEK
jgi:hypothetical protein